MDVLVSIITVAYNSEKTIRDTIESVLNQTYKNIEYIIIDGLSKDKTVEIALEYKEKFEQQSMRYTVLSEKDKGIYDAMNKGIKLASGELIGIINSDDWYEKHCVEYVVDTYKKDKFDMFYADLRIIKQNGACLTKKARLRKYVTTRDWNHPTTFITKEVYEKYQYKCESIHDDWDMVLRIRRAGYKIVIANEILANFRFGGISNKKNLKDTFRRIKIKYRIYRNNGYNPLYLLDCTLIELVKLISS
jgi:glycosyltransferase involved in cell wall biosynthesis